MILYEARIVNAQDYSLAEIEEAELYIHVPFYLMRYEDKIKRSEDITYIEQEIENVINVIENSLRAGEIDVYVADVLQTYAQRILTKIAQKSDSKERLVDKMSGQVIVTLSDVLNEAGQKDGLSQGISQGLESLVKTLKEYVTTPEEVLDKVKKNQQYKGVTLEEIKKFF